MCRLIKILFFSISILFSQSSSLSFYGQGELFDTYNASAIAQGNSKYFGQNNNGFSLSSPSTYHNNDFSLLSFSLNFSNNVLLNKDKIFKNNFQLLFFSIPLSLTKSISFGLKPLYRSELEIYDENYTYIGADIISPLVNINSGINQGPMSYISSFDLDGGISELFIAFSTKVGKKSSLGISLSKLFGTSKYRYSVDLYSLSYTSEFDLVETAFSENNFVMNSQKYSSSRYMLEFRSSFKKLDFVFDYSLSNALKVHLKEEVHFSSTIFEESTYPNLGRMESNGLGFKYNIREDFSFNSEYRKLKSFKAHEFLNIFSYQNPDVESIGCGFNYKIYNKSDYHDSMNLRLGVFRNDYTYNIFNVLDNGFTIGLGINYLEERNSFDFAFKFGTRKSDYLDFNNEKYYNFYFTIVSSENWFNNKRNK